MKITLEDLLPLLEYRTARSGGAGGQHVNKVETKVTVLLDLASLTQLSEDERQLLAKRLASHMHPPGILHFTSQESRSQLQNRKTAEQKLLEAVNRALKPEKPRKKTKPSRSAVQARLDAKRKQALKKINRRPDWD